MLGLDFAHAWDESESVYFVHAGRYLFAWRGLNKHLYIMDY